MKFAATKLQKVECTVQQKLIHISLKYSQQQFSIAAIFIATEQNNSEQNLKFFWKLKTFRFGILTKCTRENKTKKICKSFQK